MGRILLAEETLDPAYLPQRLVRRETELDLLTRRYRDSLRKGIPYHQLLTGGVGSGKTALAKRIGEDLSHGGKLGPAAVLPLYVNCWRRSSDRTVILELLRGVGVSIPDRGYGLSEMLNVFEQGIRKSPRHLLVILDEVSALVRLETKLVYLLTRSGEVGLGSISLLLIASEDVLPYLDDASRSSFGVTHRLALRPYDQAALTDILEMRAELALRKGAVSREVLSQIARIASGNGDARFALEILYGAARIAEGEGNEEVSPEHVRAARGSVYPTLTESRLEELPSASLLVLLALARSLRGPHATATTERVRALHHTITEEYGEKPVSRTTFWRSVKELEREGFIQVEARADGESARLSMDEMPTSFLATLVESRFAGHPSRKP